MEKSQGILNNLFITPIRIHEYIISKMVSLTMLAMISSSIIAIPVITSGLKPLPFLIGVLLTSLLSSLLGLILGVRVKSVNGYILMAIPCIIVFILPILEFAVPSLSLPLWIVPTKPSLFLVKYAMGLGPEKNALTQTAFSVFMLCTWISAAYLWASKWFQKYVVNKIGDGN